MYCYGSDTTKSISLFLINTWSTYNKATLTLSWCELNNWHFLSASNTGSTASSMTLCVQIGGRLAL